MSFTLDIAAFAAKAKKSPETVMRNTTMSFFGAIIDGSPVAKEFGGRFRMNWQASGATPATGVLEGRDPTGNTATSKMIAVVKGLAQWHEFTLTNNLPYANVIEYGGYPGDGPNTVGGYSKQAPSGLVRVNIKRFNTLLAEEAAKLK